MSWCFRLRLNLGDTSKLQCPDPEWVIEGTDPPEVVKLVALDDGATLAESRNLALRGSGYASEAAATRAGKAWRARLMRTFACVRIGADFGDRAPWTFITDDGLRAFAPGQRALNDVHGLAVFECEPPSVFFRFGPVTAQVSSPQERLVQAMGETLAVGGLTEERQVAYDFFAASFSQRSADARFALLMTALESLIEPRPRPAAVRQHVESLIKSTGESDLPPGEVRSLPSLSGCVETPRSPGPPVRA